MASLSVESSSHHNAVKIVNYVFNRDADGYNFQYDLSDGHYRRESGWYSDGDKKMLRISGQYGYIAPDGKVVDVRYTADEDGFIVNPPLPVIMYSIPFELGIDPAHLKATLLG